MINRLKSAKDFKEINQKAIDEFPKPKTASKTKPKIGSIKNKKDFDSSGSLAATDGKSSYNSTKRG